MSKVMGSNQRVSGLLGESKKLSVKLFSDPWQDLEDNYGKGGYRKLTMYKETHPHLKVLIALGGWNDGSEKYSKLVADPERRRRLIKNALEFITRFGFDGLDLNWAYPTSR
jgi:chitinase